ncbi:MAG: RNA polymerase sigma factor [Candidatus Pacebacteria bacterium]|nr:RNA polymerase sigma factor [Candidatus Paceibacterota bacterium]
MKNEELKNLVGRIKNRDNQAFADLFDLYYPKILNYSLRSTMDMEHAKDITSNTFIKILDNFDRFEWKDDSSFNAWIYRIATNEINQFFRKQNRYKLIIDEVDEFIISDDSQAIREINSKIAKDEYLNLLNKALSKLNTDFQSIIRLHYIEELPYEEIAKILNKNESTIRVYSKRAKEKLKEIISNG